MNSIEIVGRCEREKMGSRMILDEAMCCCLYHPTSVIGLVCSSSLELETQLCETRVFDFRKLSITINSLERLLLALTCLIVHSLAHSDVFRYDCK